MKIAIAARFRPYTHHLGNFALLPASSLAIQAYPNLLRVFAVEHELCEIGKIDFSFAGPIDDFTVQTDLEKNRIVIWGKARQGFFRYFLSPAGARQMALAWDRQPQAVNWQATSGLLADGLMQTNSLCRLFLGISKQGNWERIKERLLLAEILPYWHAFAMRVPVAFPVLEQRSLAAECQNAIQLQERLTAGTHLKNLFLAGFKGIFVPRLQDEEHQGFLLPVSESMTSMALLNASKDLIESLFFHFNDRELRLLPCLPPELHCGRMTGVKLENILLDFEWTKKKMRRMMLLTDKSEALRVLLPKDIHSFRLTTKENEKGALYSNGSEILLEPGVTYLCDRFE